MKSKQPTPLQAAFWLTGEERLFLLAVCTIALLGLTFRYFSLRNEDPEVYTPSGVEQAEKMEP